jgi:hypothetical protein
MIRYIQLFDTALDYTLQFIIARTHAHTLVSTVMSSIEWSPFTPHDSRYAGSKPGGGSGTFKGGKIQGTSPPGGTLSCVSRVVDLRHVKEIGRAHV